MQENIIKDLWKRKSLSRIFFNSMVHQLDLQNKVILDIGGGDKKSSYHEILKKKGNRFISVDITEQCDYQINLEYEKLPFEDESQDIIFCFNVMEHIFNYQNLIDEIYRVLKKDGKLYFYVPFLKVKHADPYDFFRYTDTTIKKLFENKGFVDIQITTFYGSGKNIHASLSWILSNKKLFFLGKLLNVLSGVLLSFFDKTLESFNKTHKINKNFLLSIYMECKK